MARIRLTCDGVDEGQNGVKRPVAIAFLICLILLPYASYIALVGLLGITLWSLYAFGPAIATVLNRSGWLVVTGGMVLSTVVAVYPLEALLQLTNFIPFFLFFAVVATLIRRCKAPFLVLESWASGVVIAAIPLNLRAIVEYYLKFPAVAVRLVDLPQFSWLYGQPDYGHRADSVFGHPNVLAAYLVMVLGLGLGLSLKHLKYPATDSISPGLPPLGSWIYAGTLLAFIGIYCSGSRNGALVAIVQVLIFGWSLRRKWLALVVGSSSIVAILAGILAWGIGGRSLGEAFATVDLRLGVWQLALSTMQHHPWLGTGLGSYKRLYVPYTVADYDSVEHAHNLWLMLGAEVGIPVMLGFTAVVGWICWRGTHSLLTEPFSGPHRSLLLAYGLGFLGCTLYGIFDIALYDSRVNVLGWVLLATIQAIPALAPPSAPARGSN